ncbi:MAG: DUF4445 domain-containing protein [Deltaproteobacteria bacterium]|nr:DUF4445 domain-containing protein [Deltaproteobacteria bacterium]
MSEKVKVNVDPEGKSLVADKGTPLLDVLLRAGMPLETACGGQGTCGKCRVHIQGGASLPDDKERLHLDASDISMGIRLACRVALCEDVNVTLPACGGDRTKEVVQGEGPSDGNISFSELVVAVDIGTTTINVEVIGLPAGAVMARGSTLNPQRAFGHDVMSRIHAARNPAQSSEMTFILRETVTGMIHRSIDGLGALPRNITRIVISGNTVMLHFFFGMDVCPMGKYPYTPQSLDAIIGEAGQYGLDAFGNATVLGLPAISAYLGGDLVAGLLATGIHENRQSSILIDIGTNSEIILAGPKGLIATSCAAGPALEGMNIDFGITASPGAIAGVEISSDVKLIVLPGHPRPLGLCGSGIIELMAELIRLGLVDSSGRMHTVNGSGSPAIRKRLRQHKGSTAFFVTDDVCFTQKDVRQVQLAKGAIFSGLKALRDLAGVSTGDIKSVVIAGEFGRHLKPEKLISLGMIEALPNATYSFVGNSSLTGAGRIAVNPALLEDAKVIASQVKAFPLSSLSTYERLFIRSLEFPKPSIFGEHKA